MKYNNGFAPLVFIAIIVGVLVVGGGAYYVGYQGGKTNSDTNKYEVENLNLTENTNKEVPLSNKIQDKISDAQVSKIDSPSGVDSCSVWLTYNGAYSVKYPSCWTAQGMKGVSIGTANSEVGVILKPSSQSSNDDSISIGGWQYECSDVNFSDKNNSLTKAYCFKSENGNNWIGEYISLSNPYDSKNLFYVPVVTRSTNPEVLKMFDLIVKNNQ